MIDYAIAQTRSNKHFKRRFGVIRKTFQQIVETLTPDWRPGPIPGAKPKLCLAARLLVTLEYWREYRTYFHIATSWGVSESTVCRIVHWVEDALMRTSPRLRLRHPSIDQINRRHCPL